MHIIMKNIKILIMCVIVLLGTFSVQGQNTSKEPMKFNLSKVKSFEGMPPDLYVECNFIDANGNFILEAMETGIIELIVTNKGAYNDKIRIKITPEKQRPELSVGSIDNLISISEDEKVSFTIPVSATIDMPTDSIKLKIEIKEPFGYDTDAYLVLRTYEYQKSQLEVVGVQLVDAGEGLKTRKRDGRLQKGEIVMAYLTVQNKGQGLAEGINYTIKSTDTNVFINRLKNYEENGSLKDLKVGETAQIAVKISPNNSFRNLSEYLPVYITLTEKYNKGTLANAVLPIPLDKTIAKPNIVDIKPDLDKLLAMKKTEVYSASDKFSSNIKVKDISSPSLGIPMYPNAVAIVIGAEKNQYSEMAIAPYAANDADIMEKYFKFSLGIKDVRVFKNEEVTNYKLSDIFDYESNGELRRTVVPGVTDVFVFYSGHGIPHKDASGKSDVFLYPWDARVEMISQRGYSINRLYANLERLGAKSVTVFMDACYSGSSKQSASYKPVPITGGKGIDVVVEDIGTKPWIEDPSFRLFTSSSNDQQSYGYDPSNSGMFTYYVAAGLQGDADSNGDGDITLFELRDYVSSNVSKTASQLLNVKQTPLLFGEEDMVLVKLNK